LLAPAVTLALWRLKLAVAGRVMGASRIHLLICCLIGLHVFETEREVTALSIGKTLFLHD